MPSQQTECQRPAGCLVCAEIPATGDVIMQTSNLSLSAAEMHAAVEHRDATYNGRFVFGVVTTGIFCRPTCPSRTAKPENRRFFASIEEALAADFRPCKRCRPDHPDYDVARMEKMARYIEANAAERLTLASLASYAGLSPAHLQRSFKRVIGVSPKAYQDAVRFRQMKVKLRSGGGVTESMHAAGFGSSSRVYGMPARSVGMAPGVYRQGGPGVTLYHACRNTSLGPLMMAATSRGICFAMFGSSQQALVKQLAKEFPAATLVASPAAGDVTLDAWMAALDAYLSANAPRPELPLDLKGTAFQCAVWNFLLSTQPGDVLSYGELARGIGKPGASRAVASACGANRVAILVPCHRVLRGDGAVGGYRWGVHRKRALLDHERREHPAASAKGSSR